MGGGRFSNDAYKKLRKTKGYSNKSREEIFTSRNIDAEMDPTKALVRESRDSEEHPETVSIIVALDVTGSMGFVPEHIVKEALPDLIGSLMEAGIEDPQVLFLGIGDFNYDAAPLQVGQFESSAELLDRWLTRVYLEGGGGGNNQEGYNLAHLFAARHTSIDCWEKRKQKVFYSLLVMNLFFLQFRQKLLKDTPAQKKQKQLLRKQLLKKRKKNTMFFICI